MAKSTLCLQIAALVCVIAVAHTYPTFWVSEDEAQAPPVANCLAHPEKAEGQHKAPVSDTASTIVVADAAGQPVTAVCPGGEYTLTVTFPQARRALLTTSQGRLTNAPEATCPGRSYTGRDGAPAPTYTDTLTVPCNVTGSSIDVAVTSAAGKTANFNNLGTQLAVSPLTECPTSTCTAAAGPRAAATNGSEALPAAATAAAAGTAAAPAPAAAAPVTSGAYRAAVPLGLAVTVLCVVLTVISC